MLPVQVFLNSDSGVRNSSVYHHTVFYSFPRPLVCEDGFQWSLSLRGLSVANSQLVINDYNRSLNIDGNYYLLAQGNYDANGLCAHLVSLTGKTWFYDATTLKINFRSPTPAVLGGTILSEVLDFPAGIAGTEFSSASTVKLTGVQSIYVDTDLPGSNIAVKARVTSTTLARIPNDCAPLATLHFEDSRGIGNILFDTAVFGVTVSLTDDSGRPLLCTKPYDMTLLFTPVQTGRMALRVDRPASLIAPPA